MRKKPGPGGLMVTGAFLLALALTSTAADSLPPPPSIVEIHVTTNGQKVVRWSPYPAAEEYRIQFTPDLATPMTAAGNGVIDGFEWTAPVTGPAGFHRLEVTPMAAEALLTANVLNRLAYGPTPDDLERVLTGPSPLGSQGYIDEQLNAELIVDDIDALDTGTNWVYKTAIGAMNGGNFIIYLSGAGRVRMDDITLVEGDIPEAGPNLLANGNFESPTLSPWQINSNYAGTYIDTSSSHTGNGCVVLDGVAAGSSAATGFAQPVTGAVNGRVYAMSYWFLPEAGNSNVTLTARLSGSLNISTTSIRPVPQAATVYPRLLNRTAMLADLRAWFLMHAVSSKHQLTEVLLQFLENHFVTQHTKTYDYFDRYYDGNAREEVATYLEFREISRWRNALLNPACTFLDLLRISAESPAMIIYLDTVESKGNARNIANENYARELLELFCNGVDNGYDQNDIVEVSKAWTGWSIEIVDEANINNPFAPRSTTLIDPNGLNVRSNLFGVWTHHYFPDNHHTNSKSIFPGKTVASRFGPPWAGQPYQLILSARNGNSGMQDGYDIINHLANLPYTMEYISVKLCRLFVHDNFVHGVYNYTDPSRSPEADLVHACMMAWHNGNPKGQIREVLRTIFDSELFRSHGGSMQKVKTPFEYVVSAIRALRSRTGVEPPTAGTDGYAITGTGRTTTTVPLARMGSMGLFDRAEPDGYPEGGAGWISAGTLSERIRYVQSLCILSGQSGHTGGQSGLGNDVGLNTYANPVALLKKKLPTSSWDNPTLVAEYFLRILYPAEGLGNLNQYRTSAVQFLNTADDGVTSSNFGSLGNTTTAYDTRVRGMVAMLMSFPRFQEQ